jgi:hypothetical protein
LLVPLIMLNAYLTFSWPNKVSFDREDSGIIWAGIYTGARTGAKGVYGDARSEPKVRPGCRAVPGYCGSNLSRDIYLDSVTGDI